MNNEGEREYPTEPCERDPQPQDVTVEPDGSVDGEQAQGDIVSRDDPYLADDSNDWQPGHEIGIETRKKKRYFWIVLAVVAALAALMAGIGYMTTPRADTITKWAREGNHAKLERFLSTHSDWQLEEGKKADTYVLAMTEALKLDQNRYEGVFLKCFNQAEDWQRAAILGKLARLEFQPRTLAQILETYKTRRYTVIVSPQGSGIEPGSRIAKQFEYLKAAVAKLPMNVADSILVCAVGNGGDDGNLGIIRENIGILYLLDNGKYPTFSRLVRNVGTIKELETREADTSSERSLIEDSIKKDKEDLQARQEAVSKSFVLNCWVVNQHSWMTYEVVVNPSEYGSGQRAWVMTAMANGLSLGYSSIRVEKVEEKDVDERYDFRKNTPGEHWPVYLYMGDYLHDQYYDVRIDELKASIASYQVELQGLDRQISEDQAAMQELQDETLKLANSYNKQ
jgi:chaperonin cofactor prefoldin